MPTSLAMPQLDLDQINERFGQASPEQIVRWAAEAFGQGLVMTSSFGAQSAVMLHLCTRVVPDLPIILIDTGYLFPETYQFVEQLTDKLKLNLKIYQAAISPAWMEAVHGKLWEQGVEGLTRYNELRKVEPMQRAIGELGVTAWLAGLRRQQTDHRASLRTVEQQGDIFKVHPILNWTTRHVHEYLKAHGLPYHPLYDKGYPSIGDWHTTQPIRPGQDERAGRFNGLKQECGLHVPASSEESQSRDSSGL